MFNTFKSTNLQNQIVNLLILRKILLRFILINMITVFMDILSGWLLYKISDGYTDMIYMYVLSDIGSCVFDQYYIKSYNNRIGKLIQADFKKYALEQYDRLSWNSKNKSTTDNFYQKMIQASNAVHSLITWGFPNMISMISSFVQCLVIFCLKGLYFPLLLIICLNVLAYIYYIRDRQIKFSASIKTSRDSTDRIRSMINLFLPMFAQREKAPSDILAMTNQIEQIWSDVDKQWVQIMSFTNIMNKLCIIFIGFGMNDSVSGFILLIKTMGSFNKSISSFTGFLNQNNRYETDFESHIKFFVGMEYKDYPPQVELPPTIRICDVKISQGGFNMAFDPSIDHLDIGTGSKILIRGRTGHGKSTFVNALMGKIGGIILDQHSPENYFHSFVDMYQNIREKLPTSTITIRQLFDDEPNNILIRQCLEPCFPDDDLDRILGNLTKNSAPSDPFDIEIKERISGGEKTRLALATRIYQMLSKPNKKIMILDEPEQGSDPEVAIKVIGNIFKMFDDKIIIMVSHICDCSLKKLRIKWDHILNVKDGIISLQANKMD